MNVQGAPKKMFYFYINTSANTYITESILISIQLAWQEASNDMTILNALQRFAFHFFFKDLHHFARVVKKTIKKLSSFILCLNKVESMATKFRGLFSQHMQNGEKLVVQ